MTPSALSNELLPDGHDLIDYILQYGGRCRGCADEAGICPTSGLPCDNATKAVRHVIKAINYGVGNGYLPMINAPSPALITELQSYRSEGVTVKPLEWERTPGGAWEATPPYWADGYLVAEQIDDGGWYASDPESETLASGVTLREAKEACQIDFSERILAALQLDYATRIKSALSPSTERGETIEGWQPIDDTVTGPVTVCCFGDNEHGWLPLTAYRYAGGKWLRPASRDGLPYEPTHWMPLPERPRALNPSGSGERG